MKKALIILACVLFSTVSFAQNDDSGQIAITGSDGNIYLYDVANETLTALTTDADQSRRYQWPMWSQDGQLAYFGFGPDYDLGVFVRAANGDSKQIFESEGDFFTYATWAPCPDAVCDDLTILYTQQSTGQLATRRIQLDTDFTVSEISQGGPFYSDWSPDGSEMVWARFGTTLEIYDVESDTISQTLPEAQGFQAAADWSPLDNRILAATLNADGTSDLVIVDGEDRQVLVAGLENLIAFEWSPDTENVAYLNRGTGDLYILDSATGNEVKYLGNAITAFFWSPDSQKLAFLDIVEVNDGRELRQDELGLRWNVYEVSSDNLATYSGFNFTNDMVYYLNFFDQFSRSHSFWSPDSRYLVYGELKSDRRRVVSLLDLDVGRATQIAEGGIGIFSYE